MWDRLADICSGAEGWTALAILVSDLMVGLAYYSIPFIMLWVFRRRQDDIPYPWLWMLFVTFIFACGTTHLAHIWSQLRGLDSEIEALTKVVTATVSVGTAIAFALVLPQINLLPSPARQTAELQRAVAAAVADRDRAIRELYHRSGNMRQILLSALDLWTDPPPGIERATLRTMIEERIRALGGEYDAILEKSGAEAQVRTSGEEYETAEMIAYATQSGGGQAMRP
jgi:hypothetical protein